MTGACSSAWLERTPDKREVDGSTPSRPTISDWRLNIGNRVRREGQNRFSVVNYKSLIIKGGCSSVGRAPALHAGGHRFEPVHLHHPLALRSKSLISGFRKVPDYFRIKKRLFWCFHFFLCSLTIWIWASKSVRNDCVGYFVAKLLRADGGCLGVKRRWKTWLAAISFGELLNKLWSGDFWMGKPVSGNVETSVAEYIGFRG